MTKSRLVFIRAAALVAFFPCTLVSHAKGNEQFWIHDLEFAAAAAGDETLAHGVYLFQVSGDRVFIQLQRITLNECAKIQGKKPSFQPRVDFWSTTTPLRLKAAKLSDNQIELSLFQAFHHGLPATMTLTFDPDSPPFSKLMGMKSQGFIDVRYFPKEIRPIDYVPIQSDRLKTLDCPVYLRGLSSAPTQ